MLNSVYTPEAEHRLRLCGSAGEAIPRCWRKYLYYEIKKLYYSSDFIIRMNESRILRWKSHVTSVRGEIHIKIVAKELEGKTIKVSRRRWDGYINVALEEM